jgi:hypothetical protein
VVNVGQPNPFDFSDFGPQKRPSAPTPPPAGPGGPSAAAPQDGGGFSTGFDPWANQPKTKPRSGQEGVFGQSGGQDAFGQATNAGTLATAGPPLKWFAVTSVLAVAGVVLALISAASGGGVLMTALAGWLLAGPLAIGALAVYTRVDTRRRSESIYSAPRWAATLYWAVLVVCVVGIALGAWQIALWAGRQ